MYFCQGDIFPPSAYDVYKYQHWDYTAPWCIRAGRREEKRRIKVKVIYLDICSGTICPWKKYRNGIRRPKYKITYKINHNGCYKTLYKKEDFFNLNTYLQTPTALQMIKTHSFCTCTLYIHYINKMQHKKGPIFKIDPSLNLRFFGDLSKCHKETKQTTCLKK